MYIQAILSSALGFIKALRPEFIRFGQKVYKNGAGSGLTHGKVNAVFGRISVEFEEGIAHFDQVIEIKSIVPGEPFSVPGDSRYLVLNEKNEALGLIFAGNDQTTYICPVKPILEKLECEIVG